MYPLMKRRYVRNNFLTFLNLLCYRGNINPKLEEYMAENSGSSNTAIVAILVIVLAAGILYFMGVFTPKTDRTVVERPTINIEAPTTPTTPSTNP